MDNESSLNKNQPPALTGESGQSRPSGKMSQAELQMEIERTRMDTVLTINELERRLSFAHFKNEVKDRTRQVTQKKVNDMARKTSESSKRWGTSLYQTIRQNPFPSLMAGTGLVWLIASGRGREEREPEYTEPNFYERRRTTGSDPTGTYGIGFIERRQSETGTRDRRSRIRERTEQMKSSVRSKVEEAKHKTSEMGDRVRDKATEVRGRAGEQIRDLRSSAADYRRQARYRISERGPRSGGSLSEYVDSNPLGIACIVMAMGAAVGLALPRSRYEDEKMGPVRDEMFDQARETGKEQVEKAESVVKEAAEAAKDEAANQGFLDEEKAEKAGEKARSTTEKASEKIKESMDPSSRPGSQS